MTELQLPTEIIRACVRRGIREFVVCGGARNASLLAALESAPFTRIWNHFEERGAGFFALGRTVAKAEACAVVVTSGTAVAELLPAVIEAYYQGRPLVVISADRPKRFRGSGAPQAIQQVNIFSEYVEGCVDLEDSVSEAFEGWSGRLPWHINLCLEEDVWPQSNVVFEEGPEFVADEIKIQVGELAQFLREDVFAGFVVLLGGLEPEDREEVFHFLSDLKVPVLADATSGLREGLGKLLLADGDRILKDAKPRKVLRIGDVPVARFWRDLETFDQIDVCSVTRTGLSGLARESNVCTGNISRILRGLGGVDEIGDVQDLLIDNGRRRVQTDELLELYPESEPSFVRLLSVYATVSESVYLGNSLPIREWNEFAQRDHVYPHVFANRGANGIDGQIASWLGATAGQRDAWAFLGDLTTLYDLSSLSMLQEVEQQGRVLVVMNNGGGRIFDRLPRLENADDSTKSAIRAEAFVDWSALAKTWGIDYQQIISSDDFEIEGREGTLLVELCPSDVQTEGFWKRWDEK